MARIWIVELRDPDSGEWLPTIGAALNREDGRCEVRDWRRLNPGDCFRLREYVSNRKGQKRHE